MQIAIIIKLISAYLSNEDGTNKEFLRESSDTVSLNGRNLYLDCLCMYEDGSAGEFRIEIPSEECMNFIDKENQYELHR